MKRNTGGIDKLIRKILGFSLVALYFTGAVNYIVGPVLFAAGCAIMYTGLHGFCPLYFLMGINTAKRVKITITGPRIVKRGALTARLSTSGSGK